MTLCQPDNKHTTLCSNVSCCSPSSSSILVRTGFRSSKVKVATPSESSIYLVRLSSNSFVHKFLWFLMWYNTAAVFFWVIDVTLEYQISKSILLFVSVSSAGSERKFYISSILLIGPGGILFVRYMISFSFLFSFSCLITFFPESCVLLSESFSRLFRFWSLFYCMKPVLFEICWIALLN